MWCLRLTYREISRRRTLSTASSDKGMTTDSHKNSCICPTTKCIKRGDCSHFFFGDCPHCRPRAFSNKLGLNRMSIQRGYCVTISWNIPEMAYDIVGRLSTIGPIVCALVVAQIGIYTAFFVDAASFVISAWLISKVPYKAERFVVGRLTDFFGPQTVFQVSGLFDCPPGAVWLAHSQIRKVR
jgi:hypothetical protein